MNKQYYSLVTTIILIVIVALVGIYVLQTKEPVLLYKMSDLNELKATGVTTSKFKDIESDDTINDVKTSFPDLIQLDDLDNYEVYSANDNNLIYYFYFEGGRLKEVSIYK